MFHGPLRSFLSTLYSAEDVHAQSGPPSNISVTEAGLLLGCLMLSKEGENKSRAAPCPSETLAPVSSPCLHWELCVHEVCYYKQAASLLPTPWKLLQTNMYCFGGNWVG